MGARHAEACEQDWDGLVRRAALTIIPTGWCVVLTRSNGRLGDLGLTLIDSMSTLIMLRQLSCKAAENGALCGC